MPSHISPLLVDVKEIKAVFGSKNKKLLQAIIRDQEIDDSDTDPDDFEYDDFDEDDDVEDDDEDEREDEDEDGEEEDLPSSKDALTHIIMGQPWARGIGSKYGYVFLAICQHLGEPLNSDNWGETRAEYVIQFDKVLTKVGVPEAIISMSILTCSGGPFRLPPRTDVPTFGTLSVAKAAKTAKTLAAIDRAQLQKAASKVKTSRGIVDSEFVIACFEELQSWCETAVAQKKDLIVFYY